MAYTPANPNGQATMANSSPVVIASDQNLPVYLSNSGMVDTFGKLMVSQSHNDIDEQFFRDDPNNILTVTATGAATAVSGSFGYAQFSTGAVNAIATLKAVTLDKTHYHSGGEIYCMFTAAFLTTGPASGVNWFQRVGLYDDNNGFYIGWENGVFGLTVRSNAGGSVVSTQTAKADFNVDILDGGSKSKFTREGTPEALDSRQSNIYRIRFGWLGSAVVKFEVSSPDGEWVLFHVIRQPNTSFFPHIGNADLPMTLELSKGADPKAYTINCNCWGAGIQYESGDWTEVSTLAVGINQAIDYNIHGLASANVYIATTSASGTVIFEASIDGKSWFTHPGVQDPNINGSDLIIESAFSAVAGSWYKIPTTGYRGLRLRTVTTLTNPITVSFVGDEHTIVNNLAPVPHNIGYAQVHKDGVYSTAQTTLAFWTPSLSTKRFVITDITITSGGTVAGVVTLYQAAAGTAYTAGTTPTIFRGEFAPTTTSRPGVVKNFVYPYTSTTVNHSLMLTTVGAINPLYIQVNGYEIF
jgi:hypothetical protein